MTIFFKFMSFFSPCDQDDDDDDVVTTLSVCTQTSAAFHPSALPLRFNYYARQLCASERTNLKVYHARSKLVFQMSLMDYRESTDGPINRVDLYLSSSGMYTDIHIYICMCSYRNEREESSAMKYKITSQRFPLSLCAARRTDAEGQNDHYQPVVVVAHHCFGSCIYA